MRSSVPLAHPLLLQLFPATHSLSFARVAFAVRVTICFPVVAKKRRHAPYRSFLSLPFARSPRFPPCAHLWCACYLDRFSLDALRACLCCERMRLASPFRAQTLIGAREAVAKQGNPCRWVPGLVGLRPRRGLERPTALGFRVQSPAVTHISRSEAAATEPGRPWSTAHGPRPMVERFFPRSFPGDLGPEQLSRFAPSHASLLVAYSLPLSPTPSLLPPPALPLFQFPRPRLRARARRARRLAPGGAAPFGV